MKRITSVLGICMAILAGIAHAQPQLISKERVEYLTADWKGERDNLGRPIVPDHILNRVKYISVEEAWSLLREIGFNNQLETGWNVLDPTKTMVGRALTVAFLPRNKDLDDRLIEIGRNQGFSGGTNQWAISLLKERDVIVVDHYDKPTSGAFIGDNLAQSILSQSGNGAIVYGQVRDITGIREIDGFNTWTKHWHPSSSAERMLHSINDAIRIGQAVCLPGDIVLASEGGVIFIPPSHAELIVLGSEVVRVTDGFRIEMMAARKYTNQQVYSTLWSAQIEDVFHDWLKTNKSDILLKYNVDVAVIDQMIKNRNRDYKAWLADGFRL
jgi:4-hydroxy-4-methyl-2-oxoglutarate aldolase